MKKCTQRRRHSALAMTIAAMFMVGGTASAQSVGDVTLYDDFNGRWIDPDKWDGGTYGADMETVWRMAGDGVLKTGVRGFSRIDKATGRQKHRNSLFMSEDVAPGVTTLGADTMVDWGYVRGCDAAASDSRIRVRLGGFFFNAGGSAFCGDRTGDIWAQIWIRDRHNDGLAKDVYDVSANVWRCGDEKCATGTSMFFKRLGLVREDELTKLALRWADEENTFYFSSSQGDVAYDYSADMQNMGDVGGLTYSKGIQTTTDIQNCAIDDDRRPYGVIAAKVDNFLVNADYLYRLDAHPGRACEVKPECTVCELDPGAEEGGCDHENVAAQSFVFDEGFEGVSVASGRWNVYPAASEFVGWQVTKGSVDVHSNSVAGGLGNGGAGGLNHVDLAGKHLGALQRRISGLVPGAEYKLKFNYARHRCTTLAEGRVQIGSLNEQWQAVNDGRSSWLSAEYRFAAGAESEMLVFEGIGNQTSCGMLIDDIHIESAVKSPANANVVSAADAKPHKVAKPKKPKKKKKKAKKSKKRSKSKKGKSKGKKK